MKRSKERTLFDSLSAKVVFPSRDRWWSEADKRESLSCDGSKVEGIPPNVYLALEEEISTAHVPNIGCRCHENYRFHLMSSIGLSFIFRSRTHHCAKFRSSISKAPDAEITLLRVPSLPSFSFLFHFLFLFLPFATFYVYPYYILICSRT